MPVWKRNTEEDSLNSLLRGQLQGIQSEDLLGNWKRRRKCLNGSRHKNKLVNVTTSRGLTKHNVSLLINFKESIKKIDTPVHPGSV